MKPLELTDKQRDKLLEMCNVLFPNRKWIFWYSENDDSSYPQGVMIGHVNAYVLGSKKDHYPSLEMHWFEFVATKLFMAVFPDEPSQMWGKPAIRSNSRKHYEIFALWLAGFPKNYFEKINLETYHPVDYLYKHFKKIKKK